MKELETLHHKFATRPDVFGDSEGEHEIEILTGEITQVRIYLVLHYTVCVHQGTIYILFSNTDVQQS